jgi:hypothetical protein
MRLRGGIVVLCCLFCVVVAIVPLYANVMIEYSPDAGGGVPAYARIEMVSGIPLVHHTADWAAITFYRDTACIPSDFNLLDFFDAPRAFGCPLTVEGFEIWRKGPWAGDLSPIQTLSYGLGAVPVWFVEWDELQEAMGDGMLTLAELESLSSLVKGSAYYFKETLHPSQGARQTKTEITARGTLEAGDSFFFQVEETHSQLKHVTIEF